MQSGKLPLALVAMLFISAAPLSLSACVHSGSDWDDDPYYDRDGDGAYERRDHRRHDYDYDRARHDRRRARQYDRDRPRRYNND